MRTPTALIVTVLTLGTLPAQAQRAARRATGAACTLDSSAAWFAKQRVWFDDAKHAWSDDTLRAALLRATGLSATDAVRVQSGWEMDGDVAAPSIGNDSALIAQLKKLASTRGATWPTRSIAGATGTRAVWTLAHRDTGLARAALKRMMEAGPDESNAADVATLEDRLRLQSGRKQLYGTQFRAGADGHVIHAPLEDSAHVDLRREEAGLPPFRVSACLAKRAVASRK
ncbi:MAG: DUF6624 domain-containing protein [bacterium]